MAEEEQRPYKDRVLENAIHSMVGPTAGRAGTAKPLWLRTVLFAMAYLLCALAGERLSKYPEEFVGFCLPAGLMLGTLLLNPTRKWWAFLLAALLVNLLFDHWEAHELGWSLVFFVGNCIEAAAGAWLMRRWVAETPRLATVREVLGFTLICALALPAAVATVIVAMMAALGKTGAIWSIWRVWWGGDLVGILVGGAAILAWAGTDPRSGLARAKARQWLEAGTILLVTALCAWSVVHLDVEDRASLKFLLFPCFGWMALRFGARGVTTASVVLSVIVAWETTAFHETAGLPPSTALNQVLIMEWFVVVVTSSGLLLAALWTERQRANEGLRKNLAALRESDDRLVLATRAANVGIWDANVPEDKLTWDDAMFGLYGIKPDQFAQSHAAWESRIHPEDRSRVHQEIQMALRGEKDFNTEFRVLWLDHSVHFIRAIGQVQRDRAGRPIRMLGTNWDITDRRNDAAALFESERRFRGMMENVHLFGIMLDAQGKILFANQFLLDLTGWTFHEVRQKDWIECFIPAEERARVREAFTLLTSGGAVPHFENEIITRTGQRRLIAWNNTELKDVSGKIIGVSSLGEDVTDRATAEKVLRASAEQFQAVVENAPEGIFVQTEGKFAYVNGPAAKLLGASHPAELVGRPVADRFATEPRAGLRNRLRKPPGTPGVPLVEELWRRLDGTSFPAEVNAVPFFYQGKEGELVFFRDVTDRKRLQDQFHQAQKMEGVGQLAGGVAHDFNNILGAMLMLIGLMESNSTIDPDIRLSLRELESHAQRAANLTRQLLMFSRRSVMQTKPLDLNEIVENLLRMLRRLLGEHIQVQFHGATGLPLVQADAGMMDQILMNLAVNARDAMPKGGVLTISTTVIALDAGQASFDRNRRPGRFVKLSVADTGTGMDGATLGRIFEPFFTTKEPGKGTGLGLATVYGIVQQHHGWVEVLSQLDQGSTFNVFLPVRAKTAPNIPTLESPQVPSRGTETILMVEDESSLRRALALCLQQFGYRVLEASNGREAMDLWSNRSREVDLLFTDMVMPEGMTGLELAERLRKEKTSLKVIISSGYSAETTSLGNATGTGIVYLPKPVHVSVLGATVRQCLDRN